MLVASWFGVLVTSPIRSASAWQELARRVEWAGFGALYAPDHLADGSIAPVPALCVAATATSQIRLGPLMINNETSHPALIARDIATLHDLSEGRAELGIGAGWMPEDMAALGRRMDPVPDRLARLAEGIATLRKVFAGKSSPPVIIGGGGRRVLTMAAAIADTVSINPNLASAGLGPAAFRSATTENLAEQLSMIRQVSSDNGRSPRVQLMVPYVGVGPYAPPVAASFAVRSGLTSEQCDDCPHVLIGTTEHVRTKIAAIRQMGVDQIVVRDAVIAQLALVFPD